MRIQSWIRFTKKRFGTRSSSSRRPDRRSLPMANSASITIFGCILYTDCRTRRPTFQDSFLGRSRAADAAAHGRTVSLSGLCGSLPRCGQALCAQADETGGDFTLYPGRRRIWRDARAAEATRRHAGDSVAGRWDDGECHSQCRIAAVKKAADGESHPAAFCDGGESLRAGSPPNL
jgi:hypothetical protein